jgi:GAF domain-containing protein
VSSGLYDVFVLGTKMFENLVVDDIISIAASGVPSISLCSLVAAYVVREGRFRRVEGKPNRHLDLLVETLQASDGALDSDLAGWTYALFTRGDSRLTGCLVLAAPAAPTGDEMFLLNALAAPTGAALATAELIEHEHELTAKLQQAIEEQIETNAAMSEMIRHLNSHQRVRDSIARAAGSGGGSVAIVRALNVLARRSVLVQDEFGNERAFAGLPALMAGPVVVLGEASSPSETDRHDGWLVAPIQSRDEMFGSLGVYDPDRSIGDDELFAIDYAATSLAIELSHGRNVAEVELRLGRDLVDDLISGTDGAGSITRAEALHYNLTRPQSVMLVAWTTRPKQGTTLELLVRQALARMRVPALVTRRSDTAIAVIAGAFDTARLYTDLTETMGNAHGSIGVGSIGTATDLPTSFAEAQRALQVRSRLHEPDGVTVHDDLGLDRILDGSNGGVEIEGFVRQWLGPLLEYDRQKQSEFVTTLAAYLDAGGNYDATATALMIHRSTLRYRLTRIRELCGRDFSDPDVRLNLHVAVRAWALLH